MISRYSVKKPFIIAVAVIIILILGGVSVSKMKTDLLPNMDLPYLAVITTDQGASAEKVETEVTDVLESSLSKVSGVSSVQSTSADNFSMVFMQFEDGTDMDSAMVKASSAVNEVSSQLPDSVGDPNYMEISMDMMATLYVAASYDNHDIFQTSDMMDQTVIPALERVSGVADVSTVGSAKQSVEVRLSDSKIEDINNKLLSNVNDELYDAKKQIDDGEAQLAQAEDQLASQKSTLEGQQQQTSDQLGQATSGLTLAISGKTAEISALQAQVGALKTMDPSGSNPEVQAQIKAFSDQINTATGDLNTYQQQLAQAQSGAITAASQFGSASAQLASAQSAIDSNKQQLQDARDKYEQSREQAISQANINQLVDKNTLASMIQAQNFSMPAGYLKSDSDTQWLVRVGEEFTSVDDLGNLLLTTIDGVGDIRLSDVADITTVDNVGDAYMRINNEDGVMLSVFKNSTASTSDVSHAAAQELQKLEQDNPGLHLTVVSDQGSYIDTYISTIFQSLFLGALLAVVVLIIFLRDWRPTLIMAFSIPFSVLCALLLMYFSGIQLNIMSLGGISLAIGMLVDNSIIVLENIYRLRARGISAARAAVQGAKQITGAVIASTLTTICVFLPIIFTTGMVNQLMMPFALTIA
ncbi:MAG: efflux RND transporter permease subunit, partial [Eggerthellaceae bacterium]